MSDVVIPYSNLKRQRLACFLPSPAQAGWECRGSGELPRERSKELMPLGCLSCSFFRNSLRWTRAFSFSYLVMLPLST